MLLLEAVDVENASGPVGIDHNDSIKTLRKLFHQRLPKWLDDARDTVASGRAALMAAFSVKAEPGDAKIKKESTEKESPMMERLKDLSLGLAYDYPGWYPHVEEHKLVSLVSA